MGSLVQSFDGGRRHSMEMSPIDLLVSSCYHDSPTPTPSPLEQLLTVNDRKATPNVTTRIVCLSTTTVDDAASTVALRRSSLVSAMATESGAEASRDRHPLPHASPPSPDATSDSTDLWSTSGFIEDDAVVDVSCDEREDVDDLLEPKLELPEEDVVHMDHLKSSDSMDTDTPRAFKSTQSPKRPRGRPRKHPLPSMDVSKAHKGRSKTGCITCRRRKKKCDETKPSCLNCAKNSVFCQGYQPLTIWQPGRDRGQEEGRTPAIVVPVIDPPPIIHGVVSLLDQMFFKHFCHRLSAVLTVEGPHKSAFTDILLPMAVQHLGLMHSILAMSSSHIDYYEPYGQALLRDHHEGNIKEVEERSDYHREQALKLFNRSIEQEKRGVIVGDAEAVRYGQMLCRVVQVLAEGKSNGEHRLHLRAYKSIRQWGHDPDPNHTSIKPEFLAFVEEYFQYHIGLDDLISLPPGDNEGDGTIYGSWNVPNVIQPEAVRLLGVQDGLFYFMSRITSIRNMVRYNLENDIDPVVDYTMLHSAININEGIREWRPSWAPGELRDLASRVYKQMMWVYLWRTIYPPRTTTWQPEHKITSVVNEGLGLLRLFPRHHPTQTLLLAPTFIIGCAAFDPAQRPQICESIANIKEYTLLKNADRCLEVLREVWRFMDEKDERSWDWQGVAHTMGLDFLAT